VQIRGTLLVGKWLDCAGLVRLFDDLYEANLGALAQGKRSEGKGRPTPFHMK